MEQNAKIIEQFTNALADLDGKIERFKNTRENAKLDNETKDSLDEVIAKLEEDKATIELIITKMVQNMKENGKIIIQMVRELFTMRMVLLNMKENGRMVIIMVKE